MLLSVDNIETCYGKIRALEGVSLEIENGEVIALLGSNGSGKSTVLKAISGLIHPTKGQIIFEGKRIEGLESAKVMRNGISLVPENRQVFPELTVKENLQMGAFVRRDKEGIKRDKEKALKYFPILSERLNQHAGTLSGGEQQMLAIGRSLMSKPKLLLTDEPSLGLAPLVCKEIYRILGELNRAEHLSILAVEQNIYLANTIAQKGYILEKGRIVLSGEIQELLEKEEVKLIYVGA